MDVEETSDGYPGFSIASAPQLRLVGATLSRVALAKLSDITMFSATFDGESHIFTPWLTALIEYERRKVLTGVYRTGETEPDDAARTPTVCLRWSTWDRDRDVRQVSDMASLQDYVATGPQIENTFTFANQATHPELTRVMDEALAVLATGIKVESAGARPTEWHNVALELADDRLTCKIDYSPLTARSEAVEAALPSWLNAINRLAQNPGLEPDDDIKISIRRSVPEIVSAEPFAKHQGNTQLAF
jgi:hypothetical protein